MNKLSALLWEVPAGPHRAVGVLSSCPKGLLCGSLSENDVCPAVRPFVRPHDINRKADSIARFSDVDEICDIGVIDDLGDVFERF